MRYRTALPIAMFGAGLLATSASASCLDEIFTKHGGDLKAVQTDPGYASCATSMLSSAKTQAHAKPKKTDPSGQTAATSRAGAKPASSADNSIRITPILRQDFTDVWLFGKDPGAADAVAAAKGATFNYTSDAIAHNDSWAVHGMAALVFNYDGDYGAAGLPGVLGLAFAPYVTIDRLKNSSPKLVKSDSDTITAGGSGEIGLDMLGGQHYFRARGAAVSDKIADTTSGNAVLEWIPVYPKTIIGSPSAIPLPYPIIYRFSPELKARYDALPSKTNPAVKEYSWRAGPQATLVYQLFQRAPVPDFLRRLHGQTSYIWLASDDGRYYRWFETSLTYNIDDAGHIGLTGSYKKGDVEDTAKSVDIYSLGLSVKW